MKKETNIQETPLFQKHSVSGCFIVNNETSPDVCGHYDVIYSDGKEGREFFNSNVWLVKYKHPVKLWWLVLK